ncbi:MAG: alkaline phosphatase [Cyanobacteria bacterium J06631_2]
MAKNVILMIGDGMGWEMTRASAIQAQIEAEIAQIREENPSLSNEEIADRFTGRTLADYYTTGKGEGTSYQSLTEYAIATTGNTYIAGNKSNSALAPNPQFRPNVFNHNTGQAEIREGFEFDPSAAVVKGFDPKLQNLLKKPNHNPLDYTFNEAPVVENGQIVGGNVTIFDLAQGGKTPWDANYYQNRNNISTDFNPNYIKNLYPDSAGTATGLYTGVKTYVGAVSVDIYEEAVKTAGEAALKSDKSIGVVSSVPFNHATPASAIAHVNHRQKYHELSFDQKVGNRDGDHTNEVDEFGHQVSDWDNIFYQIVNETKPTVVLGGGHYLTEKGTEAQPNETYITKAEVIKLRQGEYDYTFLERGKNASQILADTAAQLNPEAGDRLFGVYGARGQGGNLPWRTANDDYSRTGHGVAINPLTGSIQVVPPQVGEDGSVAEFIAQELDANPNLEELTQAALDVLEDDPDGFWLMIEGGDIDWAAHGNDMDNLLGTLKDFDESVAAVKEWIDRHGGYRENLLIVTADHDHYLTLTNNFPEVLAQELLIGEAGTEMTLDPNVAKSGHFWGSKETVKNGWGTHTTRPVPVYYQGADSEIIKSFEGNGYQAYGKEVVGVGNYIDQTHLGLAQLQALENHNSVGFGWQLIIILLLIIGLGTRVLAQLRKKSKAARKKFLSRNKFGDRQ